MGYETKADAVVTASGSDAIGTASGSDAASFDAIGAIAALRGEVKQDMDAVMRRLAGRPVLAAGRAGRATAFADAYLRKGADQGFEVKRLTVSSGAEGGLAVPTEIDQRIETTLKSISPIRAIADVVKIGSANYRKLVAVGGVAAGWVAESAGRPETATPTFAEIAPPMGEIYALSLIHI